MLYFPESPPVSVEAKNFLKEIFILKPSKRLTAQQIIDHPFINKVTLPSTLPKDALTKKVTEGDI